MINEFITFFFSIAALSYTLQLVFEKIEKGESIVVTYLLAKLFKRTTDIFCIMGLVSSFIYMYKMFSN